MGNILISPHGLFSICYCRKLNEDKLIGPSQMVFCGKGLKISLSCLCNYGQFLHQCYTYLRLAWCVNCGCCPTAQGSIASLSDNTLWLRWSHRTWPKGGFRSSHSFCLEPQIILLGLGQDRQTLRLLWLALPCTPQEAVSSGGIKW